MSQSDTNARRQNAVIRPDCVCVCASPSLYLSDILFCFLYPSSLHAPCGCLSVTMEMNSNDPIKRRPNLSQPKPSWQRITISASTNPPTLTHTHTPEHTSKHTLINCICRKKRVKNVICCLFIPPYCCSREKSLPNTPVPDLQCY